MGGGGDFVNFTVCDLILYVYAKIVYFRGLALYIMTCEAICNLLKCNVKSFTYLTE